jgi:hypothetical protein
VHAGEYRLCVIDACSAVEVALDAALTARLRAHGLTGVESERLLRLGSGIAEAFPVYQQLVAAGQSAVSRNRVIDQLANPRNRAVHAGEHPDETVAERALETSAGWWARRSSCRVPTTSRGWREPSLAAELRVRLHPGDRRPDGRPRPGARSRTEECSPATSMPTV